MTNKDTPQSNTDWRIEAHYTCKHSDKYDYACGECISQLLEAEKKRCIDEVRNAFCDRGLTSQPFFDRVLEEAAVLQKLS